MHEGCCDFFGEPGGVRGVAGVVGQGVRCNMPDALDATLQHVACHLPDALDATLQHVSFVFWYIAKASCLCRWKQITGQSQ